MRSRMFRLAAFLEDRCQVYAKILGICTTIGVDEHFTWTLELKAFALCFKFRD